METAKNKCCSCGCGCSPQAENPRQNKRIVIDFLYLDLSICTRCQGTEAVLEEAMAEVSQVLQAAGFDVIINRVNITSRELAIAHRFLSSPTIRVNGRDIDTDVRETLCESCGDLCGERVDCRVWTYQGREYTVPPKAMIVDALLRAAYTPDVQAEEKEYALPPNLARFFDAMESEKGK